MKFTAPPDVTSVDLSVGPVVVENGAVTVPDDLPEGDLSGLRVNGFTPVADTPIQAAAATTTAAASTAEQQEG